MVPTADTVENNSGGLGVLLMGLMTVPAIPDPNDMVSAATRGEVEHVKPIPGPTDQRGSTSMVKSMYPDHGQKETIVAFIQLVGEDNIHGMPHVRVHLKQKWL